MSPTEVFGDAPYFAVFCLAMSSRIVRLTALPNPYVRMMTELLSSKFLSLMVWKISSFFPSEGAPSVRNKMTLFFFTPDSSETEPFSRLNAFSNANLYWVCPVNRKETVIKPRNATFKGWHGRWCRYLILNWSQFLNSALFLTMRHEPINITLHSSDICRDCQS